MNNSDGTISWGPKSAVFAVGVVVVAVATVWALLTQTPVDQLVAGFFAVAGGIGTAAAFMMRERLTAGPSGLVVAGPLGRTTVGWSQITRIQTVARSRMGLSSTALEIDLDDDRLFIFGSTDLGTDPKEVAAHLHRIQPG